jgi:TATA-box binding protein (TBP) (component of TFIID and TFIIIB)
MDQPIDYVKPSALRVSTKVITAHVGTTMDLGLLFQNCKAILIPLWYPGEGLLKMEHEKEVIGLCARDAFSKRRISDKTFFNQSTIVVRKATNLQKLQFKEVNIKLFANGGVQMTGVPAEDFAKETLEWLLQELLKVPANFFGERPVLDKFKVQLINSDYSIAHQVRRDVLHNILTRQYGLFSTFEGTIYQGVNTKYYYNDTHPDPTRPGICLCSKRCRGQGSGSGPGQCKRITMSIFQTGNIIITGARYFYQIEEAYNFLNKVLQTHAMDVLRISTDTPHVPEKTKSTSKPKTVRKKKSTNVSSVA